MSLPKRLGSMGLGAALPGSDRNVARCVVCGSREVTTDEVADVAQRWVLLAECPHCDHRWTESVGAPTVSAAVRPPARVPGPVVVRGRPAREVADAA